LTQGRLHCVFGCGGDRDKTKRPIMGGIAARWADAVYVTSDNPRTENPDSILADIIGGIPHGRAYALVPDRRDAILEAVKQSAAGDCVLIAGKGHEDYQIVGKTKHPFSDQAIVREFVQSFAGDVGGQG
jgi:UDP-N-acetylmuramoyl-L-alanyl-D-glutamate--2,6-diaminopimelate ligase